MPRTHLQQAPRSKGSALIVVLTIIILGVLVIAALFARAPSTKTVPQGDAADEKVTAAIAPVARVEMVAAQTATGPKTGEQVVQSVCGACHATGAAGAPKIGDNAAWGPRIATGFDSLLHSALNGKNAMPPKGGNPNLSDLEIARAIVYMTGKSGGHFKEPEAKK